MSIPKKPFPGSHLVLSFGMILISAVYARWQYMNKPPAISPTEQFKNANDAFLEALSRAAGMSPSAGPGSSMMGGPMMRSGQYANGSYTGSAADAYYGTVQVKAVVQGGRLIDGTGAAGIPATPGHVHQSPPARCRSCMPARRRAESDRTSGASA